MTPRYATEGALLASLAGTAGASLAQSTDPFPAQFELSSLNGADGFVINGIDWNDQSGFSVSSAGDVNGEINTFIARFLAGDLVADFNGDGFLDNGDINAFIAAFLQGC